jgi:signal transduction histidine kinase
VRSLSPLTKTSRDKIVLRFLERMEEAKSPLVAADDIRTQLLDEVNSILDDYASALGGSRPLGAARRGRRDVGGLRASQGIHPTTSIEAAAVLLEVAIPELVRGQVSRQGGAGPAAVQLRDTAVETALILVKAVMERVVRSSTSYVEFLLHALGESHLDERRRLSRELHDRISHSVAKAMHDIEMCRHLPPGDTEAIGRKVDAAELAIRSVLQEIRQMSAELRASVSPEGLRRALWNYVAAHAPPRVRVHLTSSGDDSQLSAEVSEELFLILREAIRNTLLHSSAAELRVTLHITDVSVNAYVEDNGAGFAAGDPDAEVTGLVSMRERAELLGGRLGIQSSPGSGTLISVFVPLPGVRP